MTTITLEATSFYFRWRCGICGGMQNKDGMESYLGAKNRRTYICRECLQAGKDQAIARAQGRAKALREAADEIDDYLVPFIRSVKHWKTGADYDAVFQAHEQEVKKLIEEGKL